MSSALGELSAKLTLDNKQYMSALGTASTGTSTFQNKAVGATVALGKFAAAAATATASALVGLGTIIVKNTSELEQNKVSFEAMLGSADKATKLLSDLAEFAKETPFELGGLQTYSKQLLAYGFSLDELIPTLTTVGNISAGLGKESLPILIRALGQIQAKGKLAGQEFLQLTETGLPIAEQLAKTMGITVQELTGNIADLDISYEDVLKTIKNIEKNQFNNLMIKQSKTLNGLWSNIKDVFTQVTWEIGEQSGLFDLVKGIAEDILTSFTKLQPVLVDISKKLVEGIIGEMKKFSESDIFKSIIRLFISIRDFVKDKLIPTLKGVGESDAFKGLVDQLGNIIDDISILFEMISSGDMKEVQKAFENLAKVLETAALFADLLLKALQTIGAAKINLKSLGGDTKATKQGQGNTYSTKYVPSLATSTQKAVSAITKSNTTNGYQSLLEKYNLKASGGLASGPTIVGENGAEALNLPSGSRVYNKLETDNMLKSGNNKKVVVNNVFNVGEGISMAVLSRELNWMYRKL